MSTSMRVSEDTRKMVIKTGGIFEQLFKRKLSLDDTVYLSSRLISFLYETGQKLAFQNRIKVKELSDGSLDLEITGDINEILPDVIDEFMEINQKLAEKGEKSSQLRVEKVS